MFPETFPRPGIAEERGEVDENRIEENLKLFGMYLEVIDVVGILAHADGLHALLNAALEARWLIAGKVEAATALQIVDERTEATGGFRGRTGRERIAKSHSGNMSGASWPR